MVPLAYAHSSSSLTGPVSTEALAFWKTQVQVPAFTHSSLMAHKHVPVHLYRHGDATGLLPGKSESP